MAISESLQAVILVAKEYATKLQKVKNEEAAVRVREIFDKQFKEMVTEANRKLKPSRWTLQFPITGISEQPGQKNQYYVQIEPPLETTEVNGEWGLAKQWTVTLTRERALRVRPGDTLKITGTPEFGGPTLYPGGIYRRAFEVQRFGEVVYVTLANTKIEIVAAGR